MEFMVKMRHHMPADHRKFIETIERRSEIKAYGDYIDIVTIMT